MIIRNILLFLTFLLTTLICFGQKEHLEPVEDFSKDGILKEYYDNMYPLLYSGFTQKPYARYTSRPYLSSEYAFSVETIEGKFYIITNKFSAKYWYAGYGKSRNSVKINTTKAEVDRDLYKQIGELFDIVVGQTREKERTFEKGPDGEMWEVDEGRVHGTTYSFTTTDKSGEIKTGETWSPHPSEKPILSRLVKVCDEICLLGIDNTISQTEILKSIEMLIKDLKK